MFPRPGGTSRRSLSPAAQRSFPRTDSQSFESSSSLNDAARARPSSMRDVAVPGYKSFPFDAAPIAETHDAARAPYVDDACAVPARDVSNRMDARRVSALAVTPPTPPRVRRAVADETMRWIFSRSTRAVADALDGRDDVGAVRIACG